MSLPFFESPLRWKAGTTGKLEVVATVPITVFGVGEATPWEPQPASAMAPSTAAAAMTAGWRTAQDSNEPLRPGLQEPPAEYHSGHGTQKLWTRPGPLAAHALHERAARPALR